MAKAIAKRTLQRKPSGDELKAAAKERYNELVRDRAFYKTNPDPDEMHRLRLTIGATTRGFLKDAEAAVSAKIAELKVEIGDMERRVDELGGNGYAIILEVSRLG